jgi:hypothetical protein
MSFPLSERHKKTSALAEVFQRFYQKRLKLFFRAFLGGRTAFTGTARRTFLGRRRAFFAAGTGQLLNGHGPVLSFLAARAAGILPDVISSFSDCVFVKFSSHNQLLKK